MRAEAVSINVVELLSEFLGRQRGQGATFFLRNIKLRRLLRRELKPVELYRLHRELVALQGKPIRDSKGRTWILEQITRNSHLKKYHFRRVRG